MDVIEAVRNVIVKVKKPSWVRTVPRNFGDKAAGTPKADEWRMLYTIFLPIALVLLWGRGVPTSRNRHVLEVTMCLVSLVLAACQNTMTAQSANDYRGYLVRYLDGVKEHFPDAKMVPNMHVAFHIYDFLFLFGPVRSWWTFPFERIIGRLQQLPQNHIYGMLHDAMIGSIMTIS
jgi:hypothetical protein